MNDSINELKKLITQNLQLANSLKNEVEKKEQEKYDQIKDISAGILDVLDSFERIEDSLTEKGLNINEEVGKTMNRYKTIQKKLVNILLKQGITKIEFTDNRLIVGLCEVIDTEADSTRKNDEIISIIRNGYIRGKELIRAAQIIVVKN